MSELNIYQRVNKVMKEVEYVQKDSSVSTGGGSYKAVSHDMVLAVLRKSMVGHGIVVQAECLRSSLIQEKAVKADGDKGHKMHLYSGDYAVHFVNVDNPEDRLSVTVNAHANDNGDKAPGKAMSYAVKYAMLKTFSLETGEDDEARFSDPYTEEQFAVYHELVETKKAYEFFLFVSTLPPETSAALYNSFPDGKKSQGKKAVNALETEGQGAFMNVVGAVKQCLADQDISVTEITDEMGPVEKQYLAKHLSDFEINQLKKIKEAQK